MEIIKDTGTDLIETLTAHAKEMSLNQDCCPTIHPLNAERWEALLDDLTVFCQDCQEDVEGVWIFWGTHLDECEWSVRVSAPQS